MCGAEPPLKAAALLRGRQHAAEGCREAGVTPYMGGDESSGRSAWEDRGGRHIRHREGTQPLSPPQAYFCSKCQGYINVFFFQV